MKTTARISSFISLILLSLACSFAAAQGIKPLPNPKWFTNPDAVPHSIDRSAMEIPIQGWTQDGKNAIYPVYQVAAKGYAARGIKGKIFNMRQLYCEIDALPKNDPIVLGKNPMYQCDANVCMERATQGIIAVNPNAGNFKQEDCI